MLTIERSLNVYVAGIPQIIDLSQYDDDFQLVFALYTSEGTFTVPSGTTAEIMGTKVDGNGYSADATISGNAVTVTGNNQMTACAGRNVFEIVLTNSGKRLATINFILQVERAALDADTIQSETVLKELNAIIDSAATSTQAAEDAEDAADRAEEAARSLTVDPTLTQSGQPADAKVTGDEINDLKEDFDEISEGGTDYIYTPLTYDPVSMERTRQGIRFVQYADGTVQASGTNDGTGSSFWGMQDADGIHYFQLSANKVYRLTGCPSGGGADKYDINIRTSSSGTLFADEGNGVIFTPTSDGLYQVVVTVRKNYAISGTLTFSPLLEERTEITSELTAIDKFARSGLGLFNSTIVTPQMFGAVADGTVNDSLAVSQADSFDGASTLFFPPGVYNISNVTAHKSWIMADDAWITTTTANGTVVTIAGDGNTYRLNCNFEDINPYWAIDVTGDYNHIEQLIVNGMSYDGNTQPYGSAALMIHGDCNTVDFARFKDFVQSNPGNDSAPQCIATLDTATDNYFADVYSYNCRGTFINAAGAGTKNTIGTIKTVDCHDNGVYCVRGGDMDIGIMEHDGNDEGFVVITDNYQQGLGLTNVCLGTLICRNCDVAMRIKNAGKVVIGTVILYDCNLGIRLDLANSESESLIINNFTMTGKMRKPFFIKDDGYRGKLDRLRIDKIFIDHADAPSSVESTDLDTYFEVSAVDELYIGECDVNFLVGDSVWGSGNIKMVLNSTPAKRSYVGKCRITSTRDLEIAPVGQELMTITNGLLGNGNVAVDSSGAYDSGLFASGAPQSGHWEKGQVINSTDTNVAEYRCVTSGSPGTWKSVQLT